MEVAEQIGPGFGLPIEIVGVVPSSHEINALAIRWSADYRFLTTCNCPGQCEADCVLELLDHPRSFSYGQGSQDNYLGFYGGSF